MVLQWVGLIHTNAIAAHLFGAIQRCIGLVEALLKRFAAPMFPFAHAKTSSTTQGLRVGGYSQLLDALTHAFRSGIRALHIDVRQHNDEFFAAPARRMILCAYTLLQALRN